MKAHFCTVVLLILSTVALADTWPPKTDNEIVALDLTTGKVLWTHKPPQLSDAHFEVHAHGLVIYPNYAGNDKSNPIFLASDKGTPLGKFDTNPSACLASSSTFYPGPKIELDNGWVLWGFSAGNTKALSFVDKKSNKPVWSIHSGGYPHKVRCWKDFVFYAFSYLSDEGILYAYQAGKEEPAWTVDLNHLVEGRDKPLTRMIFQVIEDTLYLEANEHIFAFAPATGQLLWHKNLATHLNLPFKGGFFGGGLNLAVFAKSGDTLVVSFEKRVVAMDLKTMRCLWHLEPDTFPHCPFPAAHNGRLFLSSGKNRKLFTTTTVDSSAFEKHGP